MGRLQQAFEQILVQVAIQLAANQPLALNL
jgi:hypothetical protein